MGNSDNKEQEDITESVTAVQGVMAGPDKEEPVASTNIMDSKEIPVKASPPREKSPTVSEVKEVEDTTLTSSVTPPDGGWGWAVVFASFMIHIIGNKIINKLFTSIVLSKCTFSVYLSFPAF